MIRKNGTTIEADFKYSGLPNQKGPILVGLIRLIFHQVDSRLRNYWSDHDMWDY